MHLYEKVDEIRLKLRTDREKARQMVTTFNENQNKWSLGNIPTYVQITWFSLTKMLKESNFNFSLRCPIDGDIVRWNYMKTHLKGHAELGLAICQFCLNTSCSCDRFGGYLEKVPEDVAFVDAKLDQEKEVVRLAYLHAGLNRARAEKEYAFQLDAQVNLYMANYFEFPGGAPSAGGQPVGAGNGGGGGAGSGGGGAGGQNDDDDLYN